MKNRLSQKEMCARYLAARFDQWIPSHELVRRASSVIGKEYHIQDADTRGYDLVKEGFTSTFFKYTFDTDKIGKYAYFKCIKKERRGYVGGLKDWTYTETV